MGFFHSTMTACMRGPKKRESPRRPNPTSSRGFLFLNKKHVIFCKTLIFSYSPGTGRMSGPRKRESRGGRNPRSCDDLLFLNQKHVLTNFGFFYSPRAARVRTAKKRESLRRPSFEGSFNFPHAISLLAPRRLAVTQFPLSNR